MPYIVQTKRDQLDPAIETLVSQLVVLETDARNNMEGNVNYVITKLLKTIYESELSYRSVNDVIGVLECAKLEFYRTVAAPYESQKSFENGDV